MFLNDFNTIENRHNKTAKFRHICLNLKECFRQTAVTAHLKNYIIDETNNNFYSGFDSFVFL